VSTADISSKYSDEIAERFSPYGVIFPPSSSISPFVSGPSSR
jgi:hypothetical protein